MRNIDNFIIANLITKVINKQVINNCKLSKSVTNVNKSNLNIVYKCNQVYVSG